jgi:hypothetical protein
MLYLLFHLGLLVLDGGGKRGGVCLQIGNSALQVADRLRILGQGRRLLRGLLLRLGGRCLRCRRCLLSLLQLLVAIAQLLLQLLNLRIHVLTQGFNLALHRRLFGYRRLLGDAFMDRSRTRRTGRCCLCHPGRQCRDKRQRRQRLQLELHLTSLCLNRSASKLQETPRTSACACTRSNGESERSGDPFRCCEIRSCL